MNLQNIYNKSISNSTMNCMYSICDWFLFIFILQRKNGNKKNTCIYFRYLFYFLLFFICFVGFSFYYYVFSFQIQFYFYFWIVDFLMWIRRAFLVFVAFHSFSFFCRIQRYKHQAHTILRIESHLVLYGDSRGFFSAVSFLYSHVKSSLNW